MNRTAWLLMIALTGCVDTGCPKGSEEVDGVCMEQSSPLTGDASPANAGSGGSAAPDATAEPDGPTGRDDAGVPGGGSDAGGDAGSPVCEGDDCEMPVTCELASTDPACSCEPGFERTAAGGECADIDECANATAGCDAHATCRNEPGTFTCECQPGYEGDGTACTENPCEPRVNPCAADTTVCRADGSLAVCDCVEGRGRCEAGASHECSVDLRTDSEHCGACGMACAGDLSCDQGECEQRVTQLSLGANHSCAIAVSGEILCWGINDHDELGREPGSLAPFYEPTPTRFGDAKLIDASTIGSCAMSTSSDLTCWGYNLYSWFAQNPGLTSATLGTGLTGVDDIAVGPAYGCTLAGGAVHCWGLNAGDDTGTVQFADRRAISLPNSMQPDPKQIDAGIALTCSVDRAGGVRCWGETPQAINEASGDPLGSATHVSVGEGNACAGLTGGRAVCWGANSDGQLGNPASQAGSVEHAVVVSDAEGVPVMGVEQVAVGSDHACARLTDGAVMCWGRRDRLGNGSTATTAQRFATRVEGIHDALEIAVGSWHSCVRRRSGQVQCWGENASGQLGVYNSGVGGIAYASQPVDVTGLP